MWRYINHINRKKLFFEGMCHIEVSFGTRARANQNLGVKNFRPDQDAVIGNDAAEIRKATSIPIGVVRGLRSLGVMEKIVQDGTVDTVSMCRPLIREPDLILKWERGEKDTVDCISCGQCSNPKFRKDGVQCMQISK